MVYVIEVIGEGFVSYVDIEANGPSYPTGEVNCTSDPNLALHFATREEAMMTYLQRSRTCPTRPDGKPNRPMTSFTVAITPLKEAIK